MVVLTVISIGDYESQMIINYAIGRVMFVSFNRVHVQQDLTIALMNELSRDLCPVFQHNLSYSRKVSISSSVNPN